MRPDPPLGVPGLADPEVIGRGGFGTVYSAAEPEFGRRVAVKVLHERLDGDDVRRAFVRECQAMGSLSGHPHIVTVHRGGTTDRDEPYIVMDLMTAGSLADRLKREGRLPWAEVVEIGVTVAGALETAHRAGVLHLDLKPANLLVSRYGEPKLGDFGIARLPGITDTTDGRVRASTAYAAPERLLEGTATVASDLYGLGATLFALLAGRPAFVVEGADVLATVARVAREPVPDLRGQGVPDPVARVVERLMAKSPAQRYASAADTATGLQAAQRSTGRAVTRAVVEGVAPPAGTVPWLVHRSTPAAPPILGPVAPDPAATRVGPPLRPRPSRRRPLLIATAVAALVLVGALATAFVLNRPTTVIGRGPTPTTGVPNPSTTPAPTTVPPDDVVAVGNGVTHPATGDARTAMRGFVTGINDRRYGDAFAYFSPDSESWKGGLETWTAGQSTTRIEGPAIVAVRDGDDGAIEVDVTFTSYQSAQFGPEGQTCTNWRLRYELTGSAPGRLIRGARPLTPPLAC